MELASADEIFLLLPRNSRAPGRARSLLREQFAAWGVDADTVATAELVLSELVTNAVRHARAPQGRDIGVRLARYDGVVRVEVADAGPAVKLTPQVVADHDERGRGLAVVAALADRWGCCPRRHGIGKAVWAELAGGDGVRGGSG
ncbi:ATP-binding protein [Streptomyces xanthophaeus]|uniref:ATP-binding protein n=1 Tax=Streptomyces xanthophaeus TaxID=67385 RepID=UPI0034147C2A